MSKANCTTIRRVLDEFTLGEEYGMDVLAHLSECSDCREFDAKQIKLRQIVGNLGTVAAPPDFDFRLRSRLASDNASSSFHFGAFGFLGPRSAAVAVALVLVVGAVVGVRYQANRNKTTENLAKSNDSEQIKPTKLPKPIAVETVTPADQQSEKESSGTVATVTNNRRNPSVGTRVKRPLGTIDSTATQAQVIRATSSDTAIPIDASQQSLKVSLFDGRGNPRTISVPTVTFGSQRVVPTATSFAPKGVW